MIIILTLESAKFKCLKLKYEKPSINSRFCKHAHKFLTLEYTYNKSNCDGPAAVGVPEICVNRPFSSIPSIFTISV